MALASLGAISVPKKVAIFQGPPLPVPLVKDLTRFETIKYGTAPFKQQVHNLIPYRTLFTLLVPIAQ
jgi:hypothetical protein